MVDEYGVPVKFLIQGNCLYSYPKETVYKYKFINERGVDTGLTVSFTPAKAIQFAELNNLRLLKDRDDIHSPLD